MKALSEATFKSLAGDAAFARGTEYYNEGRVGELEISQNRITAEVRGTQDYHVVLTHTAKLFEGYCTCPASDRFDFCKHCVAASLRYYYQTQTNQELADAPQTQRVQEYLATLTKPQLVDELYKLVSRDQAALDHWQLRADIASGGLSVADVRKRITKAIPYKPSGLWRYRDVANYFLECEQALSLLDEPIRRFSPDEIVKLVVYSAQRLEKTLHHVDDSGGFRFPVEAQIQAWFIDVLTNDDQAAGARAQTVIDLICSTDFNYTVLAPATLANEHLPATELEQVYKALDEQWQQLKPSADQYSAEYHYYARFEHLLLNRARQNNELEQEFRILEKGAVTIPKCLELVELCIEHHRLDDAQRWLSYATEIEPLGQHQLSELETSQIHLWQAQGEAGKALDALWSRFEEREDLQSLNQVLKTADLLDQRDEKVNRAIHYLSGKLTNDRSNLKNRGRAETLVEIHLAHGTLAQAYTLSKRYPLRVNLLAQIVNASDTFSDATFALIERVVNHQVRSANNEAYDSGIKFLRQQFKRIPKTDTEKFEALIMRLYNEPLNKRKSNFVKRLKTAFRWVFESR